MAQCVQLNALGKRCWQEAQEGESFCARHLSGTIEEGTEGREWRRLVFRLVALGLLLLFLLPLLLQGYRLLRAWLN